MTSRIRHVVAFRARERSFIPRVAQLAQSLDGCSGVADLAVRLDLGLHPPAYHVLLITTHDSADDLAAFRADEHHLDVARQLVELTESRATVDFALEPGSGDTTAQLI